MLTSLQGAYTLAEKVLGKGTYGKVRVATCEATGCEYTCKTIDKQCVTTVAPMQACLSYMSANAQH